MKQSQKHIVIDARIRRASTGRYVDRLIEHLQDIDSENNYTILLQPDDDWKPRKDNFCSVPCKYKQFSFNPLDQIGFAYQLYKLRADLVHFPLNQQPLFYFRPVVTSTLDLTMLRFTRAGKTPLPIFWIKMAAYRFLFWYSNKKSKAIITISNFVKEDLAKHYPFTINKTTTTYCASEPPLAGTAKAPSYISKKDPFLLYVGTAFPHKNLSSLVKIMPELLEKHPTLKLVLAGKKEQYYEKLDKEIKKRDLSSHVITPGFISDAELKWLYTHCKAYVFPSLSEGFGLPGLEAMVHGAPVVSSNATCLPEIYSNAALFFNPNNLEDMTLKIERILEDKVLRKELITKGYAQVKKYSWEKMASETHHIYMKALAK